MLRGLSGVLARIDELRAVLESSPAAHGAVRTLPTCEATSQPFEAALLRACQCATPTNGTASSAFDGLIAQAASRYGLDPRLIHAVVQAESGYNPRAVSRAGARGLMQLMPETWQALGVTDPFDPAQNLNAGARYLRSMLDRFGTLELALAAYNAGPGAVQRHGGIPPYRETQAYVARILSSLADG